MKIDELEIRAEEQGKENKKGKERGEIDREG